MVPTLPHTETDPVNPASCNRGSYHRAINSLISSSRAHFGGRVAQLATSQGLLHLPLRTLISISRAQRGSSKDARPIAPRRVIIPVGAATRKTIRPLCTKSMVGHTRFVPSAGLGGGNVPRADLDTLDVNQHQGYDSYDSGHGQPDTTIDSHRLAHHVSPCTEAIIPQAAVERRWHILNTLGQILALSFRCKSLKHFIVYPRCSEAGREGWHYHAPRISPISSFPHSTAQRLDLCCSTR